MPEHKKTYNKKRIAITVTTTICLLILPHVNLPADLSFAVPASAEGLALLLLIWWSKHKAKKAVKKTTLATVELKTHIDDDIQKIKEEINTNEDQIVCKLLQKQLLALYEERNQESTMTRNKLRGDIKKYKKEEAIHNDESNSLKEQLTQKAEEELDKIQNKNNKEENSNHDE